MALDKLTKITSQSGITTTIDYTMSDLIVDSINIAGGGTTLGKDFETRNLKVTGLSTFVGNVQMDGNLTVNGTTTTLDTNLIGVDRVEVVASDNNYAGIAVTQSGTGDIISAYDGSTQVFAVNDGNRVGIADSIYHIGDDNTAFGFPSADTFKIDTAGVERLRIDSNGYLSFAGDTNTYIHHPSADQLAITRAGGSKPLIRFGTGGAGGSVGINTTVNMVTNSEILAVYGYSSLKSPNKDYAALYLGNEGNTNDNVNALILFNDGTANRGGIGYTKNTGELRFNNQYYITFNTGASVLGGTERLRIGDDGQLTQTASSGDSILHIKRSDANTTGLTGGINFVASDDHSVASIQARGDGDNEGAHLQFYTTTAAAGDMFHSANVERLRITSGGKILINTTTVGSFEVDVKTVSTNENLLRLNNSAESSHGDVDTKIVAGGSYYQNLKLVGSSFKFNTFNGSSEGERVRIDSSGRLLIGTTTEGYSGAEQLTVATSNDGGITIRTGTGSGGILVFSDGTSGAD